MANPLLFFHKNHQHLACSPNKKKKKRKKEKKEKKNSQKSPTGQPLLPFKCLDQHFQNNLQQLKKISRIPYYIWTKASLESRVYLCSVLFWGKWVNDKYFLSVLRSMRTNEESRYFVPPSLLPFCLAGMRLSITDCRAICLCPAWKACLISLDTPLSHECTTFILTLPLKNAILVICQLCLN